MQLYEIVFEYQDSYDWFVNCVRHVFAKSSKDAWQTLIDYLNNEDVKLIMTSITPIKIYDGLILRTPDDFNLEDIEEY